MSEQKPPDLRDLANRWALQARDYAREAKNPALDPAQSNYRRGLADGYYRAATDLAEHIRTLGAAGRPAAATAEAAPAAEAEAPAPAYAQISINEVLSILEQAGTNVRDITENGDHSYSLIFSRWENIMPHERLDRIKAADLRVIILNSGKSKDTSDPFIDIAFKPS